MEQDALTIDAFGYIWKTRPSSRGPREAVSYARNPQRVAAGRAALLRRAPEVMVKVTQWKKGQAQLKSHIAYLTRNGKMDLETEDGLHLRGKGVAQEIAEEWGDAETRRSRYQNIAASLMLSMPAGTDPNRFRAAVRDFAAEQFGGQFPYVAVFHHESVGDKAKHPHVHLLVSALGRNLQRLTIDRRALAEMRVQFAEKLRARGIEASATAQLARGKERRNLKQAEYFATHGVKRGQGRGAQAHRKRQAYRARLIQEMRAQPRAEWTMSHQKAAAYDRWHSSMSDLLKTQGAQENKVVASVLEDFLQRNKTFVSVADQTRAELLRSAVDKYQKQREQARTSSPIAPVQEKTHRPGHGVGHEKDNPEPER